MANQKQKEKKKKERERKAHARVLRRREALRMQRKKEQEMERQAELEYELKNGKRQPIISDPVKLAELEKRRAENAKANLEKNMKILEALEAEFEQEQAQRKEVNEKLESEGHKSIREKMDALHKKALEMQGLADKLAKAKEEAAAEVKSEKND